MFWFHRLSLGLLLLHLAATHAVFMDGKAASEVLTRRRRANSFLEELKQGNMERECVEERCSWEEAREIFENPVKTNEFWAKYVDGDACESRPCAHGGLCKDGIGSYNCYCETGYQGFNCEIVIPQLCENKNGGCEHFCSVVRGNIQCSCTSGYFLGSDDKSCLSNETFKCGALITADIRTVFRYQRENTTLENHNRSMLTDLDTNRNITVQYMPDTGNLSEPSLPDKILKNQILEELITSTKSMNTRIVGGEDCPPGECPWQALLMSEDHRGFCGGTILNEYIILTAAHCMNQSRYMYVRLGEFDVLVDHGNEATHHVETIITNNKFRPDTYHNDIALIKLASPIKFSRFILPACLPEQEFAEKVLMRQADGMVSGFGRLGEGRQPSTILQRLTVPYVDRSICMESTKLRITPRMFCAGYDTIAKDACQGDSGGPHVTRYHSTYFVTGIVSWGEGCARRGKYGVYTQVSKYIDWIRLGIERLMPTGKGGSRVKRHRGPIERLVLFSSKEKCFGLHRPTVCSCGPSGPTCTCWRRSCRGTWSGSVTRSCATTRRLASASRTTKRRSPSGPFTTTGTSVTRTHAFTEGTAPTKSGGSTAPAPPRTTVQSVNWKLWQTWETECCPPSHHKSQSVRLKVRRHVTSCARRPNTPSPAPACRDSNYTPTDGAASLKLSKPVQTGYKPLSVSSVEFPCGRLPDKFNSTVSMCHHGDCPWQVSLFNSRGVELCSGVVLGRFSVLTAARCIFLDSGSNLQPNNFHVVSGDRKVIVPVQVLFIHNRFHSHHHDHDLVLLKLASPLHFGPALIHLCLPTKDFSENILMHPGKTGIVERRGVSRTQKLVYMMLDECRSQLNVSHPLSNKMFCMRRQNGAAGNRNRVYRSPNGPSRYQNGAQQMLNRQNGTQESPDRPLGNQNGTQESPNPSLENQNGSQESPNRPLGNQNGSRENPNQPVGNHNGSQKRLNGHTVNQSQTHDSQSGTPETPNGVENNDPSKIRKASGAGGSPTSKVRGKQCGGLLPGTPVATVDRGTAFLTGILVSSSAGCDGGGLVFTKLSRYLGWIRPRLEAFEDHMTTQVSQYPEMR
ncbi:Coagulation factor X [Larimichthys crocea]|nr:Coagulation factor X [Larimichthys crocea]